MSSLFDPKNPNSINHLKKLASDMTGMVESQVNARNRPRDGYSKGFTRFCPICGMLYERSKVWSKPELKEGNCEGCRQKLIDGFTACVTVSRRFAFLRLPDATRERFRVVSEVTKASDDDRAFLKKLAESKPGTILVLKDDELTGVEDIIKQQSEPT